MFVLFGLATLVIAAALLAWLSLRTWRARTGLLKWAGTGLAALLSAALTLTSLIAIAGLFKLHARSAPAPILDVEGSPDQILRGRAIADGFCSACHSKTGTMTGGV